MRCLALAEELANAGNSIAFAVRKGTRETAPRLASSGFEIFEITCGAEVEPQALKHLAPHGCKILVVDHYDRDARFERACREWARSIVVFDDQTGREHDCDVLLDSGASDPRVYTGLVPAEARILSGTKYALLGRTFVARREASLARRDGRPVRNILVSFGSTDPSNATSIAIAALAGSVENAITVVALSSASPHRQEVESNVGERVQLVLDHPDMASLMTDADIALGAGGVTAFERAGLGLPSIIVTTMENQEGIAATIANSGAAVLLGPQSQTTRPALAQAVRALTADSDRRLAMSASAARLVDGLGARRVAQTVMERAA